MDNENFDFPNFDESMLDDPEKTLAKLQEYIDKTGISVEASMFQPASSPIFEALASTKPSIEQIKSILEEGTNPNETRIGYYKIRETPLSVAVRNSNFDIAKLLIEFGADVHFIGDHNYSIILHACQCRDTGRNDRLVEFLTLLLERGANPNIVSSFGESALGALTSFARYDAVRLLLDNGAEPENLYWTPLHRAVALGTLDDVQRELQNNPDVDAKAYHQITPMQIALQIGDLSKVKLLQKSGAAFQPKTKWANPYTFAFQSGNLEVLQYLLDHCGTYIPNPNYDIGPISEAIQNGTSEMVELVLKAFSKDRQFQSYLDRALNDDETGQHARLLIEHGANQTELHSYAKRGILGHNSNKGETLEAITPEQYAAARSPRFGRQNPEEVNEPYWNVMIRFRCSAYAARTQFKDDPVFACGRTVDPVWCADRFGQSMTFLPDGRIIEIAGEHEDGYDPDFCIYNDVFEHSPDGSMRVFCYPQEVFPPTDFHTATLVGDWIYIVGSLGYQENRKNNEITVYRLNTETFEIERVETKGSPKLQLSRHRAWLENGTKIHFADGKKLSGVGKREKFETNSQEFVLDLPTRTWIAT